MPSDSDLDWNHWLPGFSGLWTWTGAPAPWLQVLGLVNFHNHMIPCLIIYLSINHLSMYISIHTSMDLCIHLVVQLLSCVWLFANPWTAAHQASLSSTLCWSVLNFTSIEFNSVQFSHSVMSDSLQPHESQHTRPSCPSQTPRVHPNPCPSSRWCHPTISSSVLPFFSCPNPSQHQGLFQWVNSSH